MFSHVINRSVSDAWRFGSRVECLQSTPMSRDLRELQSRGVDLLLPVARSRSPVRAEEFGFESFASQREPSSIRASTAISASSFPDVLPWL